ncbi:MAG: NfeD family protein [Firmicutes bacterium]|nr:NfeD family protein [Bacillota bacterium]
MEWDFFWLVIILLLSFVEVATVNLVTVWFIASALVSLLLAFLNVNFIVQFAVFVILGIILLLTTRNYLVGLLNKNKQRTNLDRVVGMEGVVTEKITKHNPGEVKVDGKKWTAVASKTISEGKVVRIKEIEGVKLIVEEE